MSEQTHDGRKRRWLTRIDEDRRPCLAIKVARRHSAIAVINTLADAMLRHGIPQHLRSDHSPEMTAKRVQDGLFHVGVKTLYIEPASPWENGDHERFNGKRRDA